MRYLLPLFFAFTIAFAGCVEEEVECPDDDDTACTCDDGSDGELQCSDGYADCICDDGDEDDADQ